MTFGPYSQIQAGGIIASPVPDVGVIGSIERLPLIKYMLRPTDVNTAGSKRCELVTPSEPFGILRSYAFSYLIPADWVNEIGGTQSIFQMHGSEDTQDTAARPPCFALQIRNDKIVVSVRSDPNAATTITPKEIIVGSWLIEKGKFVDVELIAKWAFDGTGITQVKKDGVLIYSGVGPNCYNDTKGPYPKIGLYHWEAFPDYIKQQVLYTTDLIITTK